MDRSPANLDSIVDRQVRLWLEERKVRSSQSSTTSVPPCITISRQYGSKGAELGRLLAEEMGFSFWDHEIVSAISEKADVDEQMLATVDEHTRNSMEVFIDGILRGKSYSEGEYLRQLMRLVHTISNHGSAVIVGRGAQYILDVNQALHIRVVSPFARRVRELANRKQITERAAAAEIERVGKERVAFIQHHYAREISDTGAYDLVVNVGTLGMKAAAKVIKHAYEARFGILPSA